jgi:type VI secretion system protein VasG
MQFALKALIDTLNATCRTALEAAAGLCVSQGHYNVEMEHFFITLLEAPETDVQRLLRYYDVSAAMVTAELRQAIETFKRGNTRTPALSPHIPHLLQEAWLLASLHLGVSKVRSGTVLMALLEQESLRGVLLESVPTLFTIPREALRQDIRELLRGTREDTPGVPSPPEAPVTPAAEATPTTSDTPALDQYTVDLTARARAGQIDPLQGRDVEIRQIIDRRFSRPEITSQLHKYLDEARGI